MAKVNLAGAIPGPNYGGGMGGGIVTAYDRAVQNSKNLIDAGEFIPAVNMLNKLLKESPRDVIVLRMIAHALMMVDRRQEAIRHFSFANKLDPTNVELLCDYSSAMRRMDEIRKAHELADKAMKLSPHHPRAVMCKARLLQSHGQSERAYEIVLAALKVVPDASLLAIYGNLCRELKKHSEGVDAMRKGLETQGLPRIARQDLLFVLGHLLDSLKEYDEAFDCFKKGNAMDKEASHLEVEKYTELWDPEKFAQIPESEIDGSRAVFIVGMPRSGTTLTEQIIASHPSANGVGESQQMGLMARQRPLESFNEAYVNKAGQLYLDMLSSKFPDRSTIRVCDKMPENFYYAGLINKILPGAKIIHCKRNPIDTCLSIFFQRFGPNMQYAPSMEHTAKQFLAYTKVIEHVTEKLGVVMHDAVYEQTTANPEESIRAMLDHVGLPFNQASMDFHKSKKTVHTASATQIRQPIYTSSKERWRNYEKHIGPMIEILQPVMDG